MRKSPLPPKVPLPDVIRTVGKAKDFAAKIGVSPQAISQWDRVPVDRVLDVEALTGIPRHDLRPDIYPAERAA